MTTTLGASEIVFYFAVWITSTLYSLYFLFTVQEDLINNGTINTQHFELTDGWKLFSRFKDISDLEWTTWKYFTQMSLVPMIMHFIGAEIIRSVHKPLLNHWYIIFTLLFVIWKYGITHMFFILLQPVIYIVTLQMCENKPRLKLWIVGIFNLILGNILKYSEFIWMFVDKEGILKDEDVYVLMYGFSWTQLRCMSYCFEHIDKMKENSRINGPKFPIKSHFLAILGYVLYFPTLFMGPIILYLDYQKSFTVQERLKARLRRAIKEISILLAYTAILDVLLHYIYFLELKKDIKFVKNLPSMALCGAGLWMGVQFYLKYLIMYGTTSELARLDHIDAPPTPRCILRIHLYSHMWKNFDVGLYKFFIKYIYKPIMAELTKANISNMLKNAIGTASPFVFVYLWHGSTLPILIWSLLNYAGVMLEKLGPMVQKTEHYAYFYKNVLKTRSYEERFLGFVSTPLLIASALSNFYLFTDMEVGNIFVRRFLSESWYNIVFIYFCLYTCCRVSSVLSHVPSRVAGYKNNNE